MKRVLTTLFTAGALAAVAVPAMAQPYGGGYRGDNQFERRLERFSDRVDRGAERGDITRRETVRLRQDIRELQRLENRYSRNGIDRREAQDLDRRLDSLEQRIRFERRDGDDRRDRDPYDRRGY